MKKLLVLVAAAMLFAAPAMALISGSAHDFTTNGGGNVTTGDSDQTCVFCHTPHGANTAFTGAPLWNASGVMPVITGVYARPSTINADLPTAGGELATTDAPLCLSCHNDGMDATYALENPPKSAAGIDPAMSGTMDSEFMLSMNLDNDHPIGFAYDDALLAADTELNTKSADLDFFGTGNDMWCSTCHDVHGVIDTGTTNVVSFLRIDNAGSALCTTCHKK